MESKSIFREQLTEKQKQFLKDIEIDIQLSLDEIEEKLYTYMQENGFENDELNDIGQKCEQILDILSEI